MAAVSGDDLTFGRTSAAEAYAVQRQRALCSRSVITFAANVSKREHLAVLLDILPSRVLPLRHVTAASVHLLSSSHVGAFCLTHCLRSDWPPCVFIQTCNVHTFAQRCALWRLLLCDTWLSHLLNALADGSVAQQPRSCAQICY